MTKTKKASIKELRPDDKNINQSSARGGEMLRRSLQEYGAARSLVADKNMRIVAGNQTLEAAAAIGLDDVVVVPTDGSKLVVVQRTDIDLDTPRGRELAIADNRTNQVGYNPDPLMLAWHGSNGADLDKFWLPHEIADLKLPEVSGLEFSDSELRNSPVITEESTEASVEPESLSDDAPKYTRKIKSPVYEIKGDRPAVSDLCDKEKYEGLIDEIDKADIAGDIKAFLKVAALRHIVFDYQNIAEYYAHADPVTQDLMEKSALIIIDFNKAIENGFVRMTEQFAEAYKSEVHGE